ncbi:probable bifunctional methylthioribulose-1-phosphate dehydratase/enolase-phosphatase E1 1 isoform X2 [Momordica charantia]|uniref:Probable bifunctional methylthioribulose-1-phosphate dehydratase/enolase-phosphatase E1 1 isoform X2 n=1 Tax=Momordica charantia TaxID=3673 RepID=A0A6J1CMB6_MOMCH|nr:probable bifunctional methylthioribulose-1-phosphate dehydratase/enolase-phosphatase E1 1 isoform X2 [Momordica charantia]
MAIASAVGVNGVKLATTFQAYLERTAVNDTNALLSELCRQFQGLRWVSGTGASGFIAIKVHGYSIPKRQQLMAMAASGVQKERMVPEDMYVLSHGGSILSSSPPKPYPHNSPNCFDCTPLSMKGPTQRIKGNSRNNAGIDVSVKARAQGLDNRNEVLPRCVVLDIEGTTTPISFVTDVLFPYARDNVAKHLILAYDTAEAQDDIKLLRSQVEDDLKNGVDGAVPIPADNAGKEEVIAALVANVEAMIKADRKITALKQLQGHIWRTGFSSNELEGVVFDDVPESLARWHALGVKVYIYSSGSRLAQRLIFGKTNYGDLRKYLSGFFDTAVGNKREISSYVEISEYLGVDKPSEILFITDVYQEAVAAKAAGLEVAISIRPGNGPLPDKHGFQTINSFSEI